MVRSEEEVETVQMRIKKEPTWLRLNELKTKLSRISDHILTFDEVINRALDYMNKKEAEEGSE